MRSRGEYPYTPRTALCSLTGPRHTVPVNRCADIDSGVLVTPWTMSQLPSPVACTGWARVPYRPNRTSWGLACSAAGSVGAASTSTRM